MTGDFVLALLGSSGLAAIVSWAAQAWIYREKRTEQKIENRAQVEIHRDELTLDLLQAARQEMSAARVEVEDLRDEVKKLRAMEQHWYHFQQSLEHLEALLRSETTEERKAAERAARALLNRMRRLNEAKGTIANETQRVKGKLDDIEKGIPDGE